MINTIPKINVLKIDEDKIWFVSDGSNELYYYDLTSDKTIFFREIENEPFGIENLFFGIYLYKDELVLTPQSANAIYRVKKKGGLVTKIELPNRILREVNEGIARFVSAEIIDDSLYMIGAGCSYIIKINLLNDTVKIIEDKDIFKKNKNDSIYVKNILVENGQIIIPLTYENSVYIYDTVNDAVIIKKKVTAAAGGFSFILKTEQNYVLVQRNESKVMVCDELFKCIEEIVLDEANNHKYAKSTIYNGLILLFPMSDGYIQTVKKENGKYVCKKWNDTKYSKLYGVDVHDEMIVFYDNTRGRLHIFDGINERVNAVSLPYIRKYQDRRVEKIKDEILNRVVYEDYEMSIHKLLECIVVDK